MLPLPSPIDVHIGKPISAKIDSNSNPDDGLLEHEVLHVQNEVEKLVIDGLTMRRPF